MSPEDGEHRESADRSKRIRQVVEEMNVEAVRQATGFCLAIEEAAPKDPSEMNLPNINSG